MRILLTFILGLIATAAIATTSPTGTVVLAGSTTTIISADATVWALSPTPANVQIVRNGKIQTNTGHVTEIAYVNGVIWQLAAGIWRPLPYASATYWGTDNISPLSTCVQPPANQAILSWAAVTINTDGTAITVPVTYNLYQGLSPTSLTKSVTGITGTTYTVSGLAGGHIYYWATTAVGAREGSQSNVVAKTVGTGALSVR